MDRTAVQDLRGVISRQRRRQSTLETQGGKLHCRHHPNTDGSNAASAAFEIRHDFLTREAPFILEFDEEKTQTRSR
jgi:hypothetical protein